MDPNTAADAAKAASSGDWLSLVGAVLAAVASWFGARLGSRTK